MKIPNILSWGAGSQSSYIIHLHIEGYIRLDHIIFSDTGLEPQYIYDQINYWKNNPKLDIPITIVRAKENQKEMIEHYIKGTKRTLRMKIWTYNDKTNHYGSHMKTCTSSYKIQPFQRWIKQQGIKEYNLFIGYSTDEQHRAKRMLEYAKKKGITNVHHRFPLIDMDFSFSFIMESMKKNGHPTYRSACFLCPFRNDSVKGMGFIDILKDDYQGFIKLVEYDVKIRNCENSKRFPYSLYLDSQCIPIWATYRKQIKDIVFVNQMILLDKIGQKELVRHKYKSFKFVKCNDSINGGCSL